MTDEREALGPHEARDQPTYEFQRGNEPDLSVPRGQERGLTDEESTSLIRERYTGAIEALGNDEPASPYQLLQEFARELEAAGHPSYAAKLAVLIQHLDPYLLPQMPVSPPVPEVTLPETAMVELTERVAVDEEGTK